METQVRTRPSRTSRRFNLISAGLAFALWGGWAFIVNQAAADNPWVSGLTQGIGSFVITLIMVCAVAWLYHQMSSWPTVWPLVLPALIVVAVTGSCLATAHALVGTPNIVRTIAPALSVAFVFNLYTARKLHRGEHASREAS